jgi:tetratricopeptide (TPR) repeat protein
MTAPIPPFDPKRQADHVVRAYQYQFLETAITWLELASTETLFVEIAEDYDLASADGQTRLTQVAHASTNRQLTLASEKSRHALDNYWMASAAGENRSISLVLHTNMSSGYEKGFTFPDGQTGIEYWSSVQLGADPSPLLDGLRKTHRKGPLLDWLNATPSLAELKSRLINRVTWRMAQETGPERKALLTALLKSRLSALGLPANFAGNATNLILLKVAETAADPDLSLRRLSAGGLNSFLNEAARHGQPGHESQWGLASWTTTLDALPLPRICASRNALTEGLSVTLKNAGVIWLHGASGTGKSTLAQQITDRIEGVGLLVDFRNQDDPSEIILRLERAYTDLTLTDNSTGIILDDVPTGLVSRNAWRFSMFFEWLRTKNRCAIITSAQAPSPALTTQLGLTQSSVLAAPYLELTDVQDMAEAANAPPDSIETWGFMVHTGSVGGHPQLVAAKIASLEHRGWPASALTEDFSGKTSEAVELTRQDARQRLLREATDDGRKLLKRLACIFLRFDRSMAIAAAAVDPSIPDPSASLDLLTGPWIERAPGSKNHFRLSPLLTELNEDLSADERKDIQASIVIHAIQHGPIPFESLDIVIWNAIQSEQSWFFVRTFQQILSLNEEQSAAFASKLSTLVFLGTHRPVMPNDLAASVLVRLIQVDVAAINQDDRLFQPIAEAALRETDLIPVAENRQALRVMALSKILFAQGGRLDWPTRLAWIDEYETLAETDPLLRDRADVPVIQDLKTEFGEVADMPGFFLTIGLQTINSPDDLLSLFTALDGLDEQKRRHRLAQFKAFSKGYDLYVQSAWASAWFDSRLNVEAAMTAYEDMETKAQTWGDLSLAHQCLIARSVLLDEMQQKRSEALAIVDAALEQHPDDAALLRQKAKVLGHDGDFKAARDILSALKPGLSERSSVDQLYTLKEEAVAAARLGDFNDARILFLEAAQTEEPLTDESINLTCHKIALRAEAALCAWRMDDRPTALRELASVMEETEGIDRNTNDTALMLHARVTWLVSWLHSSTSQPQVDPPPTLVAGATSALDTDVPDSQRDAPENYQNVKVLLLVTAMQCGIANLDLKVNWRAVKRGMPLIVAGAEFDLAVQSRAPTTIATAILNVGSGFKILIDKSDPSELSLPLRLGDGVTADTLKTKEFRAAVEQLVAIAAFWMREQVASISAFLSETLAELDHLLGGDGPNFVTLSEATKNQTGLHKISGHAERLIISLRQKAKAPLHPSELLAYHLDLIACASISGAGVRTVQEVLSAISNDWSHVIEHQRFALNSPSLTVPRIKSAVQDLRSHHHGALANLLDAASQGLHTEVDESWRLLIDRVGGER